ncbi:hypothetical protein ACN47E_004282 [Coniothyrium glycines]
MPSATTLAEVRRHLKRKLSRKQGPQLQFLELCKTCNEDILDADEFFRDHGIAGEYCDTPRKQRKGDIGQQKQWNELYKKILRVLRETQDVVIWKPVEACVLADMSDQDVQTPTDAGDIEATQQLHPNVLVGFPISRIVDAAGNHVPNNTEDQAITSRSRGVQSNHGRCLEGEAMILDQDLEAEAAYNDFESDDDYATSRIERSKASAWQNLQFNKLLISFYL